jgi:hypothetical protein
VGEGAAAASKVMLKGPETSKGSEERGAEGDADVCWAASIW